MKKLIICDLDGCLIDSSWIWQVNKNLKLESPQCWELFENNSVSSWNEIDNFLLKFLREKLQQGFRLLFLTARSFTIENKTIDFITQKTGLVVGKDFLAEFRPMDDTSSPEDFKSRVVKRYLESGAEIELAIDDNKNVVEMYKSKNIPSLRWVFGYIPREREFLEQVYSWRDLNDSDLTDLFCDVVNEMNARKVANKQEEELCKI